MVRGWTILLDHDPSPPSSASRSVGMRRQPLPTNDRTLSPLGHTDWTYAAEGGKHALFAYVGTSHPELRGRLLRVSKSDLARSEWVTFPHDATDAAAIGADQEDSSAVMDADVRFVRTIVAPRVSPQYLEVPQSVSVSWALLRTLRQQTLHMQPNVIPPRRRTAWSMDPPQQPYKLLPRTAPGWLLSNYRTWSQGLLPANHPIHSGSNHLDCISMEIKPKAGYTAIAPLVDPKRRVKYAHTRYHVLQTLLEPHPASPEAPVYRAPWMNDARHTPQRSHYSPLDMFSNDRDRVARALHQLLQCPQNNLRVWCDDQYVWGYDSSSRGLPRVHRPHCLADHLGIPTERVVDGLVDVVSCVLVTHEPQLLQQVQALQRLDVVDADGAVLLYQRLVQLLNGSLEDAERWLDRYEPVSMDAESQHGTSHWWKILGESPIQPPSDLVRIEEYCELVLVLKQKLAKETFPESEELDAIRQKALTVLDKFDQHDCRYLLQNWLLSLAMCDVSLFLRFRRCDTCNWDRASNQAATPVVRGLEGLAFHYDLKLIDCGYKPAVKLQGREEKEMMFDHRLDHA